MSQTVDINQVLKGSVSEVSIDALSKKGFKQVKVLNQGTVMRLITEAVDRVLADRSKEISQEERKKVIEEARTQFEVLAKKRLEKERTRIDDLEQANRSLASELDTLKKRASASIAVQAERDQAVARLSGAAAEGDNLRREGIELQERLAKKDAQIAALEAESATKTSEFQKFGTLLQGTLSELKERAAKAESEQQRLKQSLLESEKRTAELAGLLTGRSAELEQAKASSSSEPMMVKLLGMLTQRLEKEAEQTGVNEIKLALDSLSRKLSSMPLGGPAGSPGGMEGVDLAALEAFFSKDPDKSFESNVSKVKVKQAKAGAVKEALAKLKQMQKGGEDGD